METVIRAAKERAISGDTVLLAPACASMDQFISYGDRGDRFRTAVEKVVRDGK
jgi:UDP-N-acetylmuramoylalanine--D-glutamate ligase